VRPIKTRMTNLLLSSPHSWDEKTRGPCEALSVCSTDDGLKYSWWRPTWSERLRLILGWPVRLCLVSEKHPPVSVDVEERMWGPS